MGPAIAIFILSVSLFLLWIAFNDLADKMEDWDDDDMDPPGVMP